MTTVQLIVCEQTCRWAGGMRLLLGHRETDDGIAAIRECRNLEECNGMLTRWPSSLVAVEVTPARFALVLKWLSRLETHFPRASAVALSGMRPVECEWALREAGAIHVARTVRQLPTVMQIVAQHSHQLPQERIGVAERILADLPWGD